MAEITAKLVKELREATNVGMMECKKALQEADGDMDKAIKLLRERGIAIAGKKASRAANQGLVAAEISEDGAKGVMIEVNCETDFVARNENFQNFVKILVAKAYDVADAALADAVKDDVVAKVAEIGENIVVRRNIGYQLQDTGVIAVYVHLGGKVGVMIEVACGKDATLGQDLFKETVKDLTLHIAASNPGYLKRDEVPEDVLAAEKDIFAKQVKDKPENIIEKIVTGKLEKYFSQVCLLEQPFVKDTDKSVQDWMAENAKQLDDQLSVRRFVRYQLGEEL